MMRGYDKWSKNGNWSWLFVQGYTIEKSKYQEGNVPPPPALSLSVEHVLVQVVWKTSLSTSLIKTVYILGQSRADTLNTARYKHFILLLNLYLFGLEMCIVGDMNN